MIKNSIIIYFLIILMNTACGVYSFTGASLDPRIETVSIQYFYDDAGGGPPTLTQEFTEGLRDYFQQNTSLQLVDFGGDLQFEGSITGYTISPLAARSGGNQNVDNADIAGQERLKINVNVAYVNVIDESKNFNRTFSFYRDYDPEREPINSNEQAFVEEILDQIILDIFNATVADW